MKHLFVLLLFLPALSQAQIIFHDDFDGDSLNSKWVIYKGEYPYQNEWEYEVADSLLTVNKVYNPSGFFSNAYVGMYYAVEYWESVEINDFDVRARVGWEQGEHQTLLFGVGHTFAPIYIKYESRPEYEHPIIWANFKSWGGWRNENPSTYRWVS